MDARLVEKYIPIIDQISNHYQYDYNIRHLLYIIIPAFVQKYSLQRERMILNVLSQTKICISPEKSDTIQAYYTSIPKEENGKIITVKYIILQNYEKISLIKLLDNLVHEFNHAIHSYQNEIIVKDKMLLLRTGLTYVSYSLPDFRPLKKDDSYLLEEILNTKQTEEIIDIIKNYTDTSNLEVANTIYAINNETSSSYQSESYYLEHQILNPILANKTFLSTLNALRLAGNVEDVHTWFNHITNIENSYESLILSLKKITDLEKELINNKRFKRYKINKIKRILQDILTIIEVFNQNCHYK